MAHLNLPTRQGQTHRHGGQTAPVAKGKTWERGWMGSLGLAVVSYYIQNGPTAKVLLYSTTIIQYSRTGHNGKNIKRYF